MYKVFACNILFSISLMNAMIFAENKIVYLISPPRSLSTAFLRMMEARKDFMVMNEPSLHAVNLDANKNWFYDDAFEDFEEIKEKILNASQKSNVFVKEIIYSAKDFLLQNQEFVQNKNVYFVFLVRNPHHFILSLYKKMLQPLHASSHIAPYRNLYEILKYMKNKSLHPLFVIRSEDLYENTSETIERFCQHIGIDNKEDALHWENLGDDFTGRDEWHEIKHQDLTYHWHGDAIQSSCFTTPHTYATDTNGIPTFEEITNSKDRVIAQRIYYENLRYYNLILDEIENL